MGEVVYIYTSILSLLYTSLFDTMTQLMSKQTIISGNYVEYKTFSRPVGYGYRVPERPTRAKKPQKKRLDNLARAKKRIFRLTMANELRYKPIFLTLTYERNMKRRETAVRDAGCFFRSIRREFPRMQYLYTLERQKRGAWHIHALIFNVPFITLEFLNKTWNQGYTDIKKTNDARHIAFYLAKYITKEGQDVEGNKRVFSCSHGLEKPKMFRYIVSHYFEEADLCYEGVRSNIINNLILTRAFYVTRRNIPRNTGG